MSLISTIAASLRYLQAERDADMIDRMHSTVTANMLLGFAVLVSFKQFGGRPIECMTPDSFTEPMEHYTESYCWSRDTYVVPFDEEVPSSLEERGTKRISYYQWVPFFLLFQALCFRLPSLLWKYMANQSGICIHDIIRLAIDEKNIDPTGRTGSIRIMCTHLQNALRFHRRRQRKDFRPHRYLRCCNVPYSTSYVCSLYLIVKALFFANAVFQLWMLNRLDLVARKTLNQALSKLFMELLRVERHNQTRFLMTDRNGIFGIQSMLYLLNDSDRELTGVFPSVSLCDMQARVLGGVQRFTIQCILVINLFNEKIFVLLWFWFTLLVIVTASSLLYWMWVMFLPKCSVQLINRHLELADIPFDSAASQTQVQRFVRHYLHADGVFALRMVSMHSNIIFGTELTRMLWDQYYGIEERVRTMSLAGPVPDSAPVFAGPPQKRWPNVRTRKEALLNKPNSNQGSLKSIKEGYSTAVDLEKLLGGNHSPDNSTQSTTLMTDSLFTSAANDKRRPNGLRLQMPGHRFDTAAAGDWGKRNRRLHHETQHEQERYDREEREENERYEREQQERYDNEQQEREQQEQQQQQEERNESSYN